MGSDAVLVVVAGHRDGDALLRTGWRRVDELERRWSRFLPDSEISALNRRAGNPVAVSADTFALVERAVEAWRQTGGLFDPTVGAALVALGYDRDIRDVVGGDAPDPGEARPAPGLAGTILDPWRPAVTLPRGVTFDPGGIGKGLAADLVVEALLAAGADGALANIGGDLRAGGTPPDAAGWSISVLDGVHPGRELTRLALPRGAIATSSTLRRRWRTTDGVAHHLIDPATGRPAASAVVSATVVAGEAWWAEALTKALVLAGPAELDRHPDVHAVVLTAAGRRHATPGFDEVLR